MDWAGVLGCGGCALFRERVLSLKMSFDCVFSDLEDNTKLPSLSPSRPSDKFAFSWRIGDDIWEGGGKIPRFHRIKLSDIWVKLLYKHFTSKASRLKALESHFPHFSDLDREVIISHSKYILKRSSTKSVLISKYISW